MMLERLDESEKLKRKYFLSKDFICVWLVTSALPHRGT